MLGPRLRDVASPFFSFRPFIHHVLPTHCADIVLCSREYCYWSPDKLPLTWIALQMAVISYLPNPAFRVLSIYFRLIATETGPETHTLDGWIFYAMSALPVASWDFQLLNNCTSELRRKCSRMKCLSIPSHCSPPCSFPTYFIFSYAKVSNISKGTKIMPHRARYICKPFP